MVRLIFFMALFLVSVYPSWSVQPNPLEQHDFPNDIIPGLEHPDMMTMEKIELFYQRRLQEIAEVTAEPVSRSLWSVLQASIKPLLVHPDVIGVRIYNQDRTKIHIVGWSEGEDVYVRMGENFPDQSIVLHRLLQSPLTRKDEQIGFIELYVRKIPLFHKHRLVLQYKLTADEIAFIEKNPVITVAGSYHDPPFSLNREDAMDGYLFALLKEVFDFIGLRTQYVSGFESHGATVPAFGDNTIDIFTAVGDNSSLNNNNVAISRPVAIVPHVLVGKAGIAPVRELSELFGKKVAVLEGGSQDEQLDNYPQIQKVHVKDYDAGYEAVRAGRAGYFINNRANAEYVLYKQQSPKLEIVGELPGEQFPFLEVSFGVYGDKPELVSIINKGIEHIHLETIKRLNQAWLGGRISENRAVNLVEKGSGAELGQEEVGQKLDLTAEERTFILEHPTIILGGDQNWGPFTILNEDGEPSGYDVDIISSINSLTGLNISFELGKWEDITRKAQDGELDGLTTSTAQQQRSRYFNFSESYFQLKQIVIVKSGNPKGIYRLDDLYGKRLGVEKGNLQMELAAQSSNAGELVYYDGAVEIIKGLVADEIDAFIGNNVTMYQALREGVVSYIEPVFFTGQSVNLVFSLRKAWPELTTIINKALHYIELHKKQEILSCWFGQLLENVLPIRLTAQEQEFLTERQVLNVLHSPELHPYSYFENGKAKGYVIDLMDLMFSGLGIELQHNLHNHKGEVSYELFKDQEADILTSLLITPVRGEEVLFSNPVINIGKPAIIMRMDAIPIRDLADLEGKEVALVKGHFFERALNKSGVGYFPVYVQSLSEALASVSYGEADATLLDTSMARYWSQKRAIANVVSVGQAQFPGIEDIQIAFSVSKDQPMLYDLLNRLLESIHPADLLALQQKWLHTVPVPELIELDESERAYLREHPILTASNEQRWAPFNFNEKGKAQGFSIDYFNLLSRKAGFAVEYVDGYSWNEFSELIKRKELDVLLNVAYSQNRSEWLEFTTEGYFQVNYGVVVDVSLSGINGVQDILDKTIAVENGFWMHTWLMDNHPEAALKTYNNTLDALTAVSLGEADAYIGNISVAGYLLKKNWLTNLRIKPLGRTRLKKRNPLYIGIQKGNIVLKSILDKAMQAVTVEEIDQLSRKWFGDLDLEAGEQHVELSEEELAFLNNKGPIRMCSAPSWAPIEWIDEQERHQGIVADFIHLLQERINHEIALIPTTTWNETIEHAKANECDFVSAITQTDERSAYLNFTNAYQELDAVIATREEQIYIQNIDVLAGKRVGVVKNSVHEARLREKHPSIQVVPVNDILEGLRMVEEKELIGFVDNLISLAYTIQKNGLLDVKISGRVGEPIQLRIGVRNDQQILYGILSKALDSISPQKRQEFANKWITVRMEQKIDYRLFWQLLTVSALIVLGVIYWNRKLAIVNQRLAHAHEELAQAQSIAGLGTWSFDVENQRITWSSEIFRMAGLEGRTEPPSFDEYLSLLHPDDVEILQHNLQQALNGESYEVELRHKRQDGLYNYTLTRAKPTIKDGKVTMVHGTVLDLTHLKQVEMALKEEMQQRIRYENELKSEITQKEKMEKALRESEHQLRLITDNTPAYIAYVDLQTMTYLFVNRTFMNAYGKRRDEIVGHHVKEIIGEANFEYALPYIEEARKGKSVTYINVFPQKAGKRWVNVHYEPDMDEQGKVKALFVLSHDITERMRVEEDLSTAKDAAERANKAKSEFIANMSHEIRTPLNAVLGFSELLEKTDITVKQQNYLQSIRTGGRTLLSLINDILDLSKIEADKMAIEKESVSIRQIMADIENIFAYKVKEKSLDFAVDLHADLPEYLLLDETRLRQVLFNVVGNAIKFTHEGRIDIRVRTISKSTDTNTVDLVCAVRDTGIGIPQEEHEKIFGSFEQQQGQNTRQYGGTGLGLSICDKLLKLMDGEILLESAPGLGATFTIILNNVMVGEARTFAGVERFDTLGKVRFAPATVLVADDVDSNRQLVRNTLEEHGLTIVEAIDGAQAVMLAREFAPDLILMDIRMPRMDGIEATRQIKDIPVLKKIPVIALTATLQQDMGEDCFQGVLEKPIAPSEMLAEMMPYLANEVVGQGENSSVSQADWLEEIDWDAIRKRVDGSLMASWKDAYESREFGDIRRFAYALKGFAEKHEMQTLSNFAHSIEESVESFDVVQLKEMLRLFGDLLAVDGRTTHGI